MPKPIVVPFLALLLAAPLAAQQDAYLDPTARELVARARGARGRQGAEIESYTAVVLQRQAVRLRLPLRDRMLYREESAMRVRWSRDGNTVIQRLGSRAEDMAEEPSVGDLPALHDLFDPDADRISFGLNLGMIGGAEDRRAAQPADTSGTDTTHVSVRIGSGGVQADVDAGNDDLEDFWIAHPLADGSEQHYRYRSGDTLSLRLPGGRTVRSVELNAIPRVASFHHLRASLWIEPESGALVRAIYRPARDLDIQRDTAMIDPESVDDLNLVPGMFRPIVFDIGLMTVEYSLWNQRHWLPHRMSLEAHVRAGVIRVPFEAEVAYRIEQVEDEPVASPLSAEDVLASWFVEAAHEMVLDTIEEDGLRAIVFRPENDAALTESDVLPPPVWEESTEFVSADEIDDLVERLDAQVPGIAASVRPSFGLQYLLGGRGLIRYNRVEALSLGVRGVVDHPLGRAHATARLGGADLHPNVELGALVPRRSFAWRVEGHHRLASVDPGLPAFEAPQPALGLGNSTGALLAGRDDGFYYRATGGFVALEPRPDARQWWRLAAFVEHQDEARRKVEWNIASWMDRDRRFAPNLVADEVTLAGASLALAPWFGTGNGPQAGLELLGDAAGIDSTFARARLTGRALLPVWGGWLGTEAALGHAWGEAPVQYDWFLGGATTVRGYDGGTMAGASMARARLELTRGTRAFGLALFADAGWAGARGDFDTDDALLGGGIGFSLMEGLLRLDVARAFASPTGWRVHFHLDALL